MMMMMMMIIINIHDKRKEVYSYPTDDIPETHGEFFEFRFRWGGVCLGLDEPVLQCPVVLCCYNECGWDKSDVMVRDG